MLKLLLVENGFGIVCLCQSVGYETYFIAEFKDMFICCLETESDGKYTCLDLFKCAFEAENY